MGTAGAPSSSAARPSRSACSRSSSSRCRSSARSASAACSSRSSHRCRAHPAAVVLLCSAARDRLAAAAEHRRRGAGGRAGRAGSSGAVVAAIVGVASSSARSPIPATGLHPGSPTSTPRDGRRRRGRPSPQLESSGIGAGALAPIEMLVAAERRRSARQATSTACARSCLGGRGVRGGDAVVVAIARPSDDSHRRGTRVRSSTSATPPRPAAARRRRRTAQTATSPTRSTGRSRCMLALIAV